MLTAEALRTALAAHTPRHFSVGASAAVLIAVLPTPDGLDILFTKRLSTLRAHPGQVSFPGGRIDPGDVDAAAAALRETHEELGIDASQITLLGQLDDVVTGTGFTVSPFVGLLAAMPELRPNPNEVEMCFWMPLARFMDGSAWRSLDITREGDAYTVWFFDDAPHTIWGATAQMTKQLVALLG